jgi:oligogalacturonide lyase
VDFKLGHIQPNPFKPGVISFCWETGGDAPQRTWLLESGSKKARPFYTETYNEWITHEVWWGSDRLAFTIWPYDEEHKKLPHGVATIKLPDAKLKVHAQYRAWHTHGSPDGRRLVGDDFEGNLWLIQAETNERRLLTQGHRKPEIKNHPHPSFTPDSKGVVLTSSKNGRMEVVLVEIPPFDDLPKGN